MNRARRLHVVDDDDAVRDSLVFNLKVQGYSVSTYADAAAFLDINIDARRACLICDIRMPGMNGIELTRILRDRGSAIPILLMTGHADRSSIAEAMRAGVNGVLEKPIDPRAIVSAIEGIDRAEA